MSTAREEGLFVSERQTRYDGLSKRCSMYIDWLYVDD